MAKVLPVSKAIGEARGQGWPTALDAEKFFAGIAMEADDLCADVQDVKTVVAVATEAWGKEHESCIGVLDLIAHKLDLIERAGQFIMNQTKPTKARRS